MCSVSELPGVRLRGLGAARGPFRRCLCWCCCCSCNGSCLAVRNGEDNGPTKKEPGPTDVLLCDGEPPPSIEEIQSWGKSFDKLMRSAAGRKVFRDFLRCEYSEENILFWLACEELKRESNPDAVEEKARFIYEDYISILSPKEVSLDSRVREVVNRNMVEPTPHTFDEAQLQIYTLMHRDSYPRFVNSALYKTLAQVASSSAGNGNGGSVAGVEEEGLSSPDFNKLPPSERRPSSAEGGKDESSNKKEEILTTKECSSIIKDTSEKKESSTEKKGVTWEKLEESDKNECIASKKEGSSDKNDGISEKKEISTQKEETISQSLASKKDFESIVDKKQSGSDKKEDSVEKKDSGTEKTESGPSKKDGGLPNNLA